MTDSFYVSGGTLRADAPCYVERQADRQLVDALTRGEFCYVLTARQMGKSSLMVRTAQKLREAGLRVAVLDLTALGQNLTPEQWYEGLLLHLGQQLDCEDALEAWWLAHARQSPLQRFLGALQDVVLLGIQVLGYSGIQGGRDPEYLNTATRDAGTRPEYPPLVLFLDEIDTVRSLPFATDEFFAAIRECANRRGEDPASARLTFCLLGVATPAELIRDPRITPFNVGTRIELADFTGQEPLPLAYGLGCVPQVGVQLLQRVLHWTGGHPYLTQRLCQAVAEAVLARGREPGPSRVPAPGPALVDHLCEELFLSSRARERDDNLLFVRERLLRSQYDVADLLDLYLRVHQQEAVPDDDANPLVGALRMSGIVREWSGRLWVRNRIYHQVFDAEWVQANRPARRRVEPVVALWERRVRGVPPLPRHGVTDAGETLVLQPDETDPRVFHAVRVGPGGAARNVVSVSGERLRRFESTPDGELMLGLAHDSLYLFREGRRTRLLPDRRMAYSDVALAPDGRTFAFASLDLSGESSTIGLGDEAGRVLWERPVAGAVERLALSPDGSVLVAGLASGGVLALDRDRRVRWEQEPEVPAGAAGALAVATRGCVAVGTAGGALALLDEQGQPLWQVDLGAPVAAVALDAAGDLLAAATGGRAGRTVACFRRDGARPWQAELPAAATGIALSPDGRYLAVSLQDGRLLAWETVFGSDGSDRSEAEDWAAEVSALVAAGDLAGAHHGLLRVLDRTPAALEALRRLEEVEDLLVDEAVGAAAARVAAGEPEAALVRLAELQEKLPFHERLFQERLSLRRAAGESLLAQAAALARGGETPRARACLRQLLRLNPYAADARAELGNLED